MRPAAVVIARAPRPELCKAGLEPVLGADGCARLQAELIRRAVAWAATVGDPYLAVAPADAEDDVRELAGGATLIAQDDGALGSRMAAAIAAVHGRHGGPVLVAGVDVPQLDERHADGALDDLADGVDVSIGPSSGGGYYLVAMREPHPEVFALAPGTQMPPTEVFARTLGAAHEAGLTVGMLRAERSLDSPADVAAFLADPLTPPEIAELLRGGRAA